MITEVTTGFANNHASEIRARLQLRAFAIGSHCLEDIPGPLFVRERKVVLGAA